jgi:hypothetical protein
MLMRDPLMYRILHRHHHRTGNDWKIYPMYDYAHGESDYIEQISHSICTLEFVMHRELYNWFLDQIQPELVSGSPEIPKQVRNDKALVFSPEATAVFDAGRALWSYYHSQKEVNVNASLYDIREYFQGRNMSGKMNTKSDDMLYMSLIVNLRTKLKELGNEILPKVYIYGFLLR